MGNQQSETKKKEKEPDTDVSLDEFIKKARSGDIVLFAGEGAFSDMVRATSSMPYWSHVGIVVRESTHSSPMLFESTKEETPKDMLTNSYKTGPKIVDLREKIVTYEGDPIVYRRLHTGRKGKDASRDRKRITRGILEFANQVKDKPYEERIQELVGSVFRANEENTEGYFCTELVAEILVRLGIIDNQYEANNFQIGDFTEEGALFFSGLYTYSNERYINRSKSL